MGTRTPNHSQLGNAAAATFVVMACVATGFLMVGHLHKSLSILPVAALAFGAVILIVAELGTKAILVWIPLSVVAYPLAKDLPGAPLVTFDRIWIGGLLILLATLALPTKASRATRRMVVALATMAAVYLVRAATSPTSVLEPRSGVLRLGVDILVLPLILFVIVRRSASRDERLADRVGASMMVAGAILGLLGIAEHVIGFQLASAVGSQARFDETIGQIRVSGPYGVPETYGLTLLLCFSATLYWTQLRARSRWPIAVLAIVLQAGGIAFTYFRVAWIGAVLILLIAFAFRPRQMGRAVIVTTVLGLILALGYSQLTSFSSFSARIQNANNFSSRLGSYEQAINIWQGHPLFGVGTEQYNPVASGMPTLLVNGVESQPDPHNSFLGVLAELGIVGFAALMLLTVAIVRLIRAMNRCRRTHDDVVLAACVLGAGVVYLIFALSLWIFRYSPSNEMFAILLGLAAGRVDLVSARERAKAEGGALRESRSSGRFVPRPPAVAGVRAEARSATGLR